jgi:hypothetical protein
MSKMATEQILFWSERLSRCAAAKGGMSAALSPKSPMSQSGYGMNIFYIVGIIVAR